MNKVLVSTLATINTMLSPLAPGVGGDARFQVFDIEGPQEVRSTPCSNGQGRSGWRLSVEKLNTSHFTLRVHEKSCGSDKLGKERAALVLPAELMEDGILDRLRLDLGYVIPNVPAEPGSRHKARVKLTKLAAKNGLTPVRVEWLPDSEADKAKPSLTLWYGPEEDSQWQRFALSRLDEKPGEVRGELSLTETR